MKPTERLIAVGDIHGCYEPLIKLMEMVNLQKEDIIVFLGDYIDRGGREKEVIEYLMNLQKEFPKAVFLKGNHEDMLEKYLTGEDTGVYLFNGG